MQGYRPATRTAREPTDRSPSRQHRPGGRQTDAGEEALATLAFLALATGTLWAAAAPLLAFATLGATALAAHAARQVAAMARHRRVAARRSRA